MLFYVHVALHFYLALSLAPCLFSTSIVSPLASLLCFALHLSVGLRWSSRGPAPWLESFLERAGLAVRKEFLIVIKNDFNTFIRLA